MENIENEDKKVEEFVAWETPAEKQSLKLFLVGIVVALAILLLIGVGIVSYRALNKMTTDNLTLVVAKAIHLPAGFVAGKEIAYADFSDDVLAVTKFYQVNSAKGSGTIPTDTEIKKSVWDRLVKNNVLEKLANQATVSVNATEINNEYGKFVTEVGSEDKAASLINSTYGWTPDQFKQKIIRPYLLQIKLGTVTSTAELYLQDMIKKEKVWKWLNLN